MKVFISSKCLIKFSNSILSFEKSGTTIALNFNYPNSLSNLHSGNNSFPNKSDGFEINETSILSLAETDIYKKFILFNKI